MAIDLRDVEPLGSKSVLLEQAMRRHRDRTATSKEAGYADEMAFAGDLPQDFEWLNEDKEAIQSLVTQMDASIAQLAKQMRSLNDKTERSRLKVEKEQQLMFKQIRTLNGLLKRQIDVFSAMERQMEDIEIKQNNIVPQVGIGLVAGLMSAVTILVSAPWMTVLMEQIR